jgi:hypothetical protein
VSIRRRRAAVLCIVLTTTACTSSSSGEPPATGAAPTTSPSTQLVHEDFPGLSFDHPAEWTSQPFEVTSSFSRLITYLSSSTLSNPCTDTSTADRHGTACSLPVTQLAPGSVLITWSSVGFGRPAGQPEIPEPNTTIGGHTARVETTRRGNCVDIGADETIVADIERPSGNHYEMRACLRGPDLAQQERSITNMLDSTRVTA